MGGASTRPYEEMLIDNISKLMKRQRISSIMLSEVTGINVSSLSKILNGKSKLTVEHMFLIAKGLEVRPEVLMSKEQVNDSAVMKANGLFNDYLFEDEILLRNPNHMAFKGYLDNMYYIYFYSTISTEGTVLEGELQFESSENQKVCIAEMKLKTGKQDKDGHDIVKKYSGELIISLTMNCCYCVLLNQKIGELTFLNFRHLFLFNDTLRCRMAGVLTTSSGENKLPTMHRALITAKQLDYTDESGLDLDYIQGQLCLNNSNIIIKKSIIDELCSNEENGRYGSRICNDIMKESITRIIRSRTIEECYVMDEATVRAERVSNIDKINMINILRTFSESPKYNKISPKTDEFTFNKIDANQKERYF